MGSSQLHLVPLRRQLEKFRAVVLAYHAALARTVDHAGNSPLRDAALRELGAQIAPRHRPALERGLQQDRAGATQRASRWAVRYAWRRQRELGSRGLCDHSAELRLRLRRQLVEAFADGLGDVLVAQGVH